MTEVATTRFWVLEWLLRGKHPPASIPREELEKTCGEIAQAIGRMRKREITPQALSNLYKVTVDDIHLLSFKVRHKAQNVRCEDGTVKAVYFYYIEP